MTTAHYLQNRITWPLQVTLIGCGGNGSQILSGLMSLNIALGALGERSLHVTTLDDDVVSKANLGRQPFFPCDLGRHKALVLTERLNIAYGTNWKAIPSRADMETMKWPGHLAISCVDTAKARREIAAILTARMETGSYWMDLGNRANDGQIVLGQIGHDKQTRYPRQGQTQMLLPTVMTRFPELADESVPEDDAPSCSLAEALEKQSLFINRTLAAHALGMLYDLFCRGSVGHAGLFLNLASGLTVPIPLDG